MNRLVKRQGSALERLVGAQGELPSLLHAHNEETRILKHKMKQVMMIHRIKEFEEFLTHIGISFAF